MAGNVSIAMKEKDGRHVTNAIGFRQKLLVGAYRQDDQSTPLDDAMNAIVFMGSMLARVPGKGTLGDMEREMVALTGAPLIDHVILNMDLFSWRKTWTQQNLVGWPEQGTRLHPSPGLWFRGSEYGRGPYIGGICDPAGAPPLQTPGIDGIPGLTTLATCAHHISPFSGQKFRPRPIQMGLRRVAIKVVDPYTNPAFLKAFGTRFKAVDRALWDKPTSSWWNKKESWETTDVIPYGVYTTWHAWAADENSGLRADTVFAFGGNVPYLHPAFGWNFNTEHWTAGGGGEPICVALSDVEILREGKPDFEPIPAIHFHNVLENPNHSVYAQNGAVIISTETLGLRKLKVGEITPLS